MLGILGLTRRLRNTRSTHNFQNVRNLQKKGMFYELGILLSKEKREERAKALEEEIKRGRFHELNELKATGGKIFEGNEIIISAKESSQFPKIEGSQLDGPLVSSSDVLRGKVSLVTICLRDIARPMSVSWTKPFTEKFRENANVQVLEIFFVDGWIYKVFKSTLLKLMKKRIPTESWRSTFVSFEDNDVLRKELNLKNGLVSYIFLVDQENRIRWKGVGYAQSHEMKALIDSALLLTRFKDQN